jgi:hypothetical protein
MNACILGTSNGIITDGYVKAIKKSQHFSKVTNLSLGASSCAFFPYRLHNIDWETTDVLFAESLVNDAASARAGGFQLSEVKNYYEDLIYKCAKNNVRLVCILLPGRTKDLHYDVGLKTLRNVLIGHGVSYWDIEKDIESYSQANQISCAELYRDAAHPHSWFIYDVASKYLSNNFAPIVPTFKPIDFEEFRFVSVQSDSCILAREQLQSKVIKTSLLSAVTQILTKNVSFNFQLNSDFRLYALVLNSSNTNCVLKIMSKTCFHKLLSFELKENDNKLIVSPMVETVKSFNQNITFTITNEENRVSEKSYQAKAPLVDEFKLELVGLIYK